MVKIISFDADGTLVDGRFMDLFWNKGIPEVYAKKKGIRFDEAKKEVERLYNEVGDEDIRWYDPEYWFNFLGLGDSFEDLLNKFKDEVKVYPEVYEVLDNLKESYQLIVVSNAPREILDFELKGLEDYFSHIFSSTSDFKEVRKTRDFYSKLCNILGIKARNIIHVGDHWKFDFIAPKKLGIEAFFLDRSGEKKGENVVKDLRELEKKIDALFF